MAFRLRYLQHNLELTPGEFLIGRSADCQLSLDDPLVSRKHALLAVTGDLVTVRDLGSRNGVLVNGVRIDGPRGVGDGDRITIGSQEMMVVRARTSDLEDPSQSSRRRLAAQTLSATAAVSLGVVPPSSKPVGPSLSPARQDAAKRLDAFRLLGGLADKAFALGHHEDAERILSSLMAEVLGLVQANPSGVHADTIDQAARYAAKLAAGTTKGAWVDYVVKLYTAARRPCPAPIVDELYGVLRKIQAIDLAGLRAYVGILKEASPSYGPAERFLLQRIEGLERLAALR